MAGTGEIVKLSYSTPYAVLEKDAIQGCFLVKKKAEKGNTMAISFHVVQSYTRSHTCLNSEA